MFKILIHGQNKWIKVLKQVYYYHVIQEKLINKVIELENKLVKHVQ